MWHSMYAKSLVFRCHTCECKTNITTSYLQLHSSLCCQNSCDKYHKNISAKNKAGYLENASLMYTQCVSPITEALDAAYMDIFSQVICYNTVFPE